MNILNILTKQRCMGNLGETAATRYLRRKGYWILERNYVGKWGEIDIIARKKNLLCFIEVKTRSIDAKSFHESRPAAAVNAEKQRRLIQIANEYVRRMHYENKYMLRMDVIEVLTYSSEKKIKVQSICHLENAFDMNTAYRIYRAT